MGWLDMNTPNQLEALSPRLHCIFCELVLTFHPPRPARDACPIRVNDLTFWHTHTGGTQTQATSSTTKFMPCLCRKTRHTHHSASPASPPTAHSSRHIPHGTIPSRPHADHLVVDHTNHLPRRSVINPSSHHVLLQRPRGVHLKFLFESRSVYVE